MEVVKKSCWLSYIRFEKCSGHNKGGESDKTIHRNVLEKSGGKLHARWTNQTGETNIILLIITKN